MNQEKKVVKINDVIENQIPEFILAENPNFTEFLKQYYISQEYQGSSVDLAENLVSYKNLDSFDKENLITNTTLSADVDYFDDVINVQSTKGWPNQYGLLKINDEIITYTGITTNSFTGCIRGFSGIESLTGEESPEVLTFSSSEVNEHSQGDVVTNLSNLFLQEFFKKIKYQFTPGFEEVEFDSKVNPQNFISKAKTFYQSKGTDEAYKILFKVLYDTAVQVLKPQDFCFTTSDDQWVVTESILGELVSGDPKKIKGQTLYQDEFTSDGVLPANGSIYEVEEYVINGITFYNLKLFSGYSNNLNPKGSISGTFVATSKTFTSDEILAGSTELFVDSTIGFAQSGVVKTNGLTITYTDKTNDQFLNCSGITNNISRGTKIFAQNYVYSYEDGDSTKPVQFRIHNVLSKINTTDISFAYESDPIKITDIGNPKETNFVNSLYHNHAINIYSGIATSQITDYIRQYTKEGFGINAGLSLTKYDHGLKTGDRVDIFDKRTNIGIATNLNVTTSLQKEFSVQQINDSSILGKEILFRRRIKKTKSPAGVSEPITDKFVANIQDSFTDNNYHYLTSNGLPDYSIDPYKRQSLFDVDGFELNGSHNFYSGELVTVVGYGITGTFQNKIGISTGVSYYVSRVNSNKIKLSESRENVGLSSYISFNEYDDNNNYLGRINSLNLIISPLYNNNFTTSKLFKKFPEKPVYPIVKQKTNAGPVGIFVNGVEIQSYKSFDRLYYGKINSIDVTNSGENYSLLNPPRFRIFDGNVEDIETRLNPQLVGKLKKIQVVDPGFDYVETPVVTISGGNNDKVTTEVKMKLTPNVVTFNSTTKEGVVNTSNNTFIYDRPHRFITGEPVIYKTFGTRPIGIGTLTSDGTLLDGSVYYIINVGAGTSFRIAKTEYDALEGTNFLKLRTNGGGLNQFISKNKKQCIDEVLIVENNHNFEYKKVSVPPEDINVYDDTIRSIDHGFETGEEIVVTVDGTYLEGLEPNQRYYIVKVDNDTFKLSSTKNSINYVDILSTDFATTYFFEYSPITLNIKGNLSVSGISTIGSPAVLVPIIEGSVVGVEVQKGLAKPAKSDLGEPNIINFNKNLSIVPLEGSNASFEALVVDGKINEVVVKTQGSNYFNNFELHVFGDGYGASLYPVITDGKITDVKIINGGVGYSQNTTTIRVIPIGKGVKLKANLQNWTISEISKLGYSNVEKGLLFGKKYSLFGNVFGTFFLNSDLRAFFDLPTSPTRHSPIVGWAYDGCPIYGPFAFTNPDGTGGLSRMRSGYSRNKISPSPLYDCVEDYTFTNSGTLDKHNGRYCKTPEFPDGVYAYFCTLDTNNVPEFPYVIGDEYCFTPQKENFDLKYNQSLNFNKLGIDKCTKPYRMDDKEHGYEYFNFLQSGIVNDAVVNQISEGNVDEILIANGGDGYSVDDTIVFDNTGTDGYGASAKVSEISGVGVSTVRTTKSTFYNVTFVSTQDKIVAIGTTSHNLESDYYVSVSGLSTSTYPKVAGFKKILVENITAGLSTYLPDATTTGLVTSIQIKESIFAFKIDSKIKIENETLTILGLDTKNNLINVLRNSGSPAHLKGTSVTLLQNEFVFENSSNYTLPEGNISYYFKSSDCVSIGVNTTPGFGNNLSVNPFGPGVSESKFVRTGGIFLPNHKFKHGEKVVYTPSSSTIVSNYGNLDTISDLYIVKLEDNVVGLVTSKSNISNFKNLLYYTASGTGSTHKFETDRDVVKGTVTLNNVIVSTASTHGLSKNNLIKLNVISGITTTFNVGYSTVTKRVSINSQVNPRIDVYENDVVRFNITSGTLSNTQLHFYTDPLFQNKYFGTSESGIVEVDRDSQFVTLRITDYTPKILYYNLESFSKQIYSDQSVSNPNTIIINPSSYNGSGYISTCTANTFTLNYPLTLERLSYTSNPSTLSYTVLSKGIKGSIAATKFISKGTDYKKIPSIKSISSLSGSGASLLPTSNTIGKIKNAQILNTKSIYPSDQTLRPISNVFSVIRLQDNLKVNSVSILDGGANYLTPPTLKLYNKKENTIISNVNLVGILKNTSIDSVQILNPGSGLKSTDNEIVTTKNTNGIRILGVSVSGASSPYTVTLTLETPVVGFSTDNQIGITTGDKIFVEGISYTGAGSGFNSSDYKYEPFTVTSVDQAFGSQDAATIQYELDQSPAGYDEDNTYDAKVINYNHIPKFNVNLIQSEFYNAEDVIVGLATVGIKNKTSIINNDKNETITNLIKVKDSSTLQKNQVLSGSSSNSRGKIYSIDNFNTTFNVDSSAQEIVGWKNFKGNLSSILQKLPDNNYYQRFSYSLKSKKPFTEWNSIVSDITHVSGYQKFSDLIVESNLPVGLASTLAIKSDQVSIINLALTGYGNVNTVSGFDLVSEEDVDNNDGEYSEFIKFKSKKLSNFLLSKENRVLSVDDISDLFNTDNFPVVDITLDTIDSTNVNVLKYIFFIASTTSFFGQFVLPQFIEVFITRNGNDVNLTQYSFFYDRQNNLISILGDIKADISPTNADEIVISFTPKNPFNSYAIRALREVAPLTSGITTTSIGYNRNVEISTGYASTETVGVQTFYTIPISECKSGTVFVGLSTNSNKVESSFELSFINVNGIINYNVYAEQGSSGIGSVGVSTSGSDIAFTYDGGVGIAHSVTVSANLNLLKETLTSPSVQINDLTRLESGKVTFSGTGPQTILTVSDDYASSKVTLEIEKTVGLTTQRSLVQLDAVHFGNYENITEYGFAGNLNQGQFTFETNYNSGTGIYTLSMEGEESANYIVKYFQRNIATPN